MKKESRNYFFERRDKYIKGIFIDHVELVHPCRAQGRICLNGKYSCPFIGLPNDTCVYYVRGSCNRVKCEYRHNEEYARFYKQAIESFNRKQKEPLTMAKRYFQIAKPYLIWILGLVSSPVVMRYVADYVTKKLL